MSRSISARALWVRAYLVAGASLALFAERLATNELAGIVLIFLPLAIAATFHGSRGSRTAAILLTVLFAVLLLLAGSRGGIVALVLGGATTALLTGRRKLLLLGLVAGLVVAAFVPGWIDLVLYDGKVQGLSLETLLTGRPDIWNRAVHMIADFPFTGIGVGTFPDVAAALYYPADSTARPEDAHSLPLQVALDFGVFGLLAFGIVLWHAFAGLLIAYRRADDPDEAHHILGLFASLSAFSIFNLFDAIAFGSVGNVAFFLLLGQIYALPQRVARQTQRSRWHLPRRLRRRLTLIAVLLLLGIPSLQRGRQLNRAALLAARGVVADGGDASQGHQALAGLSPRLCRAGWLEGKTAAHLGLTQARDQAWTQLMACSPRFVSLVAEELPQSRLMAQRAIDLQPESAAVHIWLARIEARGGAADRAIALYNRALELDPKMSQAWLELGHLLRPREPEEALDAYGQSCRRGDPGANACWLAGQIAEELDDVEAAIGWYQRSRWPPARLRLQQLSR